LKLNIEQFAKPHEVHDILLHYDWQSGSSNFDADLALLVLESPVDLSNQLVVGVVCLPPARSESVSGVGKMAGWGISEWSESISESYSFTPNEIELSAVSRDVCLAADYNFQVFTSPRTFCAGIANQNKSSCKGDSGGGFFQFDSFNGAFNVIGISSSSVLDSFKGCRTGSYSVFTDVTKFVGWIDKNIEETKDSVWKQVHFECKE
jgi:secreted trypsin-like serine protease